MTKREKAGVLAGTVLTVGITGYSAWKMIGTGILFWHVKQPEFVAMMMELILVFLLFFFVLSVGRTLYQRVMGIVVITAIFSWLHVIFIPVFLAAAYLCYLIILGQFLATRRGGEKPGITWSFVLGMGVTITVFCLMSLLQIGSINMLRIWVVGTGSALIVWGLRKGVFRTRLEVRPMGMQTSVMLAAIMALVFLQMGRMNHAVDFDSIWYGTRSAVMLNSGNSIYENLGTLGVVYTYPKGFEVLTLPLAGIPSYSFPIAFNMGILSLVLYASFETACVAIKRRHAYWVPFLMAAVPGIMNMGGTAKADIMTLFLQILMIQSILSYKKDGQATKLMMGLSAGAMSLTMKPTAVVFSTAILGMAVVWLLWDCRNRKKQGTVYQIHRRDLTAWAMLGVSTTSLLGIWGRTMKLVGVPVTSVFYELFQKIGFQVKYPFYASGFPSSGAGMNLGEALRFLGVRLYGILLNPQSEDMGHVIIAWGTVLPFVMFLVWMIGVLLFRQEKETERERTPGFLTLLLPAILLINLISLYSLSQIDGNYYMLLYFIMILFVCMACERYSLQVQASVRAILLPAWLFGAIICGLTNWAWALGMGDIQVVNRGYYNHVEAQQSIRVEQGSGAIWDMLAQDSKHRVIALGNHPGVLTFPCSVQSYVDVSGYWGNPEVVSGTEEFLRYLQYADIDYLYMEKEYIDTSVRIYQIVRTLVREGWLYDVRDENGNLILAVQKGRPDETGVAHNLEIFDTRYIQHP